MAQGSTKGLQKKKESSHHAGRTAANTRKGRRAVPPKKPAAVKQAALHKSLSAKIGRSIEKQMVSAATTSTLTIMKNEGPESVEKDAKKSKK